MWLDRFSCGGLVVALLGCGPAAGEGVEDSGERSLAASARIDNLDLEGADKGQPAVVALDGLAIAAESTLTPSWAPSGELLWKLVLSSNEPLSHAFSYVPDDPFGEAALANDGMTVTLTLGQHEMLSILNGLPLWVQLKRSAKPDQDLTFSLGVAPRFTNFSGSKALFVDAKVRPVLYDDHLLWRASVTSSLDTAQFAAPNDFDAEPTVRERSSKSAEFDWAGQDFLLCASDALRPQTFAAEGLDGTVTTKSARFAMRTVSLGLTDLDPYEAWPTDRDCKPEVDACLKALPAESVDYGQCGRSTETMICNVVHGSHVDAASLQSAKERASDAMDTTLELDAKALVGYTRMGAFVANVTSQGELAIDRQSGRAFPSVAHRDSRLDRAAGEVRVAAYARPLPFLNGATYGFGTVAGRRHRAADAVLERAGQIDWSATAEGRSLEDMVADTAARASYIAELRYLRTLAPRVVEGGVDAFAGSLWGVESMATIERKSGAVIAVTYNPWGSSVASTAEQFAQDFREHLVGWYADHWVDIQNSALTLAEAQALISAERVEEVTAPDEDPEANDFSKVLVVRHPDVVWPGSDIVWFGAYDRASGALIRVYDFN